MRILTMKKDKLEKSKKEISPINIEGINDEVNWM